MVVNSSTPYIWPQYGAWLGLDGNWSTLPIAVGTSPQLFAALPATSTTHIFVPLPEGCTWLGSQSASCAKSRGVNSTTAVSSIGFQTNASTSWHQLGLYSLWTERELFGDNQNGLYGLDFVALGGQTSITIDDQLVVGVASEYFWLGGIGLSDDTTTLDSSNFEIASLLGSLFAKNMIPSMSYGLAVGAAYSSSYASLILGGYDEALIKPRPVSFSVPVSRSLLVNLAGIVATNTLLGTASMLLWLPIGVCEMFARSFGLLYDNATNLYLLNSTMHGKLQQLNPQLTFTIAGGPSSNTTTAIVFPYAAFDLTIGLPTYNSTYRYFPIRQAANETQYVLGRAFLQEAYLIVDWERRNFSIGQAVHQSGQAKSIVTVLSPKYSVDNVNDASHLPVGILAGVIVGLVAILVLLVTVVCYWRRKAMRSSKCEELDNLALTEAKLNDLDIECHVVELQDKSSGPELMSEAVHELNAGPKPPVLVMSTEIFELDASSPSQELAGDRPDVNST